jgi:hypothetical protein
VTQRLSGAGRPEWDLLERRLEAWLPTWNPGFRHELVTGLAGLTVDRELASLDQAIVLGRAEWVIERVPELTELAARLARHDRPAAERLLAGVRLRADDAQALAVLLLRSPAVLQGVLRGPELELAIVDGQVVAPGEPLADRAGAVRRHVVLAAVPGLDRVVIACDGQRVERRLPE